jgi:hypothetical protein
MPVESYPSWNPYIPSITGNPQVGKKLKIPIHPLNKSPMTFDPIVLICETNQELRWNEKLGISGIFLARIPFHEKRWVRIKQNVFTERYLQGGFPS